MKKAGTGKSATALALKKGAVAALSNSLLRAFVAGLFLSAGCCLLPAAVSAAAPPKFTYQGNLRQAGFLVNGQRNMVFRIYASSDTMTPLWTSPPYNVQLSTGVFRVTLEPSGMDWEAGSGLWLEMEVENIKLSPREEITSVPFSINSSLHSGKRYTSASSGPSDPNQGDLWMDTGNHLLKYWNGSAWVDTSVNPAAVIGDNLGSHIATTTLDMNAWGIVNAQSVGFGPGVYVSSASAAQLDGVYVSSNIYIVGVASATRYYGDGSALTGITAPGDNLGNHTAVQTLDMAGQSIVNVASATFSRSVTVYSTFTVLAPDSAASSVWISTSAVTPHLYVASGGNVGLGTASPGANLDVAGAGDSGKYIMILHSGPKIAAWLRNK